MDDLSRRKLKKLKQKLAKGGGTAEEARKVLGVDALAEISLLDPPGAGPLRIGDVQNALLWSLTQDVGSMPPWMMIKQKPLLRGCTVILAPSLSADCAEHVCRYLTPPREVKMPRAHQCRASAAVANELLQVKMSMRKRKASALDTEVATHDGSGNDNGQNAIAAAHPGRHSLGGWRRSYLKGFAATPVELRENGYPIGGDEQEVGYEPLSMMVSGADDSSHGGVRAAQASGGAEAWAADADAAVADTAPSSSVRLLAIDCEMVLVRGTEMVDGGWPLVKQLARVAVVDDDGAVLMDEYVVPERPVVDYLTRFSGVTREHLESATTTLEAARARVRALARGRALVGHSLESDLHALRLTVAANGGGSAGAAADDDDGGATPILDTALLFPLRLNRDGPPAKAALRNLTVAHLKREIQQPKADIMTAPLGGLAGGGGGGGATAAAASGHSPAEDATAALDLAALKLERGLGYGTPGAAWGTSYEPLHAALCRSGWAYRAVSTQEASLARSAEPSDKGARGGDVDRPPASIAIPPPDWVHAGSEADAISAAASTAFHGRKGAEGATAASSVPRFTWLALPPPEEGATAPDAAAARALTVSRLRDLVSEAPRNTMVVLLGTQWTVEASREQVGDGGEGGEGAGEGGDGSAARTAVQPGWVAMGIVPGPPPPPAGT